jgi:TetR/AcrR family transcriptional regulator, cholesterol catabolism regulator
MQLVAPRTPPAPAPTRRAIAGARPAGQKSARKRQSILDAAARLFCERGYAGVRLEDIAQAAGTQSGAMYYYFHSKEELVEELLKLALAPAIERLQQAMAALPADASYRERITVAIRAQLTRSLQRSDYTLAFMKIHDQVPESVQARFAAYPKSYADFWGDLLKGALEGGELREDVNVLVLRTALMGSLVAAVEWFRPGKLMPEQVAEQMTAIFFGGIWREQPDVRLPPATEALVRLANGLEPAAVSALAGGLQAFARASARREGAPGSPSKAARARARKE